MLNIKYELVENAKIEERDGELHLVFSTNGLSPFAIVVDSGESAPAPANNGILVGVLTVIAVAEGAALIAILVKFILGKKPIGEFDSYVEELKKIGIEKVIETRQSAYDRYIAR